MGAAVAAAAAGAWMLRDTGPSGPGSGGAVATPQAGVANPPASASGLPAPAAAASAIAGRFKLTGLMSGVGEARAFISVDGQPAREVRVGEVVDGDWVLREVAVRSVMLAPRDGGPGVTIELSQEANAAGATPRPATAAPPAPLADGSPQSQEALRKLGARNPPLRPPIASEAQKPPAAPPAPVDDGRWRPAGS